MTTITPKKTPATTNMAAGEFLKEVLPAPHGGKYCLVRLPEGTHKWFDTREQFITDLGGRASKEPGWYYGTAVYGAGKDDKYRRTKECTRARRALHIDIDAGAEKYGRSPDKAYPTREDAETALGKFIADTGLPYPSIVVYSGEGLHAYWTLDSDMTDMAEWGVYARGLARLALKHGFKVDPACTRDCARLLRPPGAIHKNGNAVVARKTGPQYALSDLAALRVAGEAPEEARAEGVGGLTLTSAARAGALDISADIEGNKPSLGTVRAALEYIPADCPRDEWLKIIIAIHSAYPGEEGRALALEWSRTSAGKHHRELAEDEFHKDWNSFSADKPGGITIATLLKTARDNKWPGAPGAHPPGVFGEGEGIEFAPGIWRFRANNRGVFKFVAGKTADDAGTWQRLCSPLRVVAKTRNSEQEEWGFLLKWHDDDGVLHQEAYGRAALQGDEKNMFRALADKGVQISHAPGTHLALAAYLQGYPTDDRVRCVARTGWCGNAYVFPDKTIGATDEKIVFQPTGAVTAECSRAGTPDEWRENVAALASGNSLLMLAMSAAFAGPLFTLLGERGFGIHLFGSSSTGKTTALKAAASVYGPPSKFMLPWRATSNGLEGVAAMRNDGILILDELSQVDPREAGDTVYMLGNGQGKVRANRQGGARKVADWNMPFLSSGETALDAHMASRGIRTNAGQEVRLINIPADAGADMGVFEILNGKDNPARLAQALSAACEKCHGAAGVAWVTCLAAHADSLRRGGRGLLDKYVEKIVPAGAEGQASRAARGCAVIALAGELATKAKITGWKPGEVTKAVRKYFQAWLERRGGAGDRETRDIARKVAGFFEEFGSSLFESLQPPISYYSPRAWGRVGFVREVSVPGTDGPDEIKKREYLIPPEMFRSKLCPPHDPEEVIRVLKAVGCLKTGADGKATRSERISALGGKTQRVYVVTSDIHDGGAL